MTQTAPPLDRLQDRLDYEFDDVALLRMAMTHRSAAYERDLDCSYERLEFLGDAVIGLVASDWLYRRYPGQNEGYLSKKKSLLVSAPILAAGAAALGVGECLQLGQGEERSGGRRKESILADAIEAVVGAVYLDAGLAAASKVVERMLEASDVGNVDQGSPLVEAKNELQELLQSRGLELPCYALVLESGPDHDKSFEVEVRMGDESLGKAVGSSKKRAEQGAAKAALERLRADPKLLSRAANTG